MGAVRVMSIACLCGLGCVAPVRAQQIDGRYLGSLYRTELGGQTSDRMSHVYDVIVRQDTPNQLRFDLGAALRYDSRFTYDSDIFRARTFGELRSRSWRLHGQFVPWQRTQAAAPTPSRQDLQLGASLTPARAPHVLLNYTRTERRIGTGESRTEDGRAEMSYGIGPVSARVGYRRLETNPPGREAQSRTQEYRGGVQGGTSWRSLAVGGVYDVIVTAIDSRERQIDQDIQRAAADAAWAPHRQLSLSASGLHRWGKTQDNARGQDDPVGETSLAARITYLPFTGLSLGASRAYQKSAVTVGSSIADYLRLEALYRHDLVRRTTLHTGYSQSIDIDSQGGSVPQSTAFAGIEGMLRAGLWAKAESRVARSPVLRDALQWYWTLQLRTQVSRTTDLEVLWNRQSLPEFGGVQQRERTWEIKAGYQPYAGATVVGSYRRLDGEGQLERQESIWSANGSWRVQERTTLNLYASTRRSVLQVARLREDLLGVDLTLRPRQLLQLRGSWKLFNPSGRARDMSYGLILTRNF